METDRSKFERAVLSSMLIYNDNRPLGYLKPDNLREQTEGIQNKAIFTIFSVKTGMVERFTELKKFEVNHSNLYKILLNENQLEIDTLGINSPKYCLLILEIELKEVLIQKLIELNKTAGTYKDMVQNVFQEVTLSNTFFIEQARQIWEFFTHIGFVLGADVFEELVLNYEKRIKRINQHYEVENLINRLNRYADSSGKTHLINDLNRIKAELTL